MIYKHDLCKSELETLSVELEGNSIPDNLCDVTEQIVAMHKANGDLDWIAELIGDAVKERNAAGVSPAQPTDG